MRNDVQYRKPEFDVNSTPDNAEIEVNGLVVGKTPWTGPVKRNSVQTVVVKKAGYEPQTVQLKGEVSGWVVVNALWGLGGLVSTSVDVGGGAGYAYDPGAYHVTLESKGTTTGNAQDTHSDSRLKRFVLSFHPDIAKEAAAGRGEKLEALMQLAGHQDAAAFSQLCRRELADAAGADAFAERMIKERHKE
ncbi:MAG: PEGA domain-containing protein [Nitrospirota bacterium]